MNHARFCRARLGTPAFAAANRITCYTRALLGDQHVRRSTLRFVLPLLIVACAGLVATDVQAHPHVWVTMTTELVYAPDGSVTAVRHAWTFDDMFSAFRDAGDRGACEGPVYARRVTTARADQHRIAQGICLLHLCQDRRADAEGCVRQTRVDYWLDYDPKGTVLTLHFTLPFKKPVKANRLTVEIYDPEFFIDFGFADRNPVKLVGAPPQCTFADKKPNDGFFSSALRLDKSFMTSEANVGMGMSFANKISVTCP